jgi:hypothetical protein
VPVLLKVPNKSVEALLNNAFVFNETLEASVSPRAGADAAVGITRHCAACCWISNDTAQRIVADAARANPGLRKRGPGASIEAAHVTGYDSFLLSPNGFGRMRSSPTAAAAFHTNG